MNASEAREQLDSVAAIVRVADRTVSFSPAVFIVWGLVGGVINAIHQARAAGFATPADSVFHLPLIIVAIAATIWIGSRSPGRETLTDRQAGVVFSVIFFVLVIMNIAGQATVVSARSMALFWCSGMSMGLLIVGFQGSRVLAAGGVMLLAAAVAACVLPGWFSGILAAGWMVGMVAPGVAMLLRGTHGRDPSV